MENTGFEAKDQRSQWVQEGHLLDTGVGSWQKLGDREVMGQLPKSSVNTETDQQIDT